jgi:ABC-type oligopeptide transport system ATPase subunit
MSRMTALVEAEGLVKHFVARRTVFGRPLTHVQAVDGVSFTVEAGKTLALVGESGSGKSTVGRLVLRLIEPTAGRVSFHGTEVFTLDPAGTRAYRRNAQLVFQDPYAFATSAARRRADGDGRTGAALCAAVSARILRRSAPAHRDRARARRRTQADRVR